MWLDEHEVDAYWPDAELVVEVDGREVHHTRLAFQKDRVRDRRLAGEGIRVARVTWLDLGDEASLAAELRAIRSARGSPAAA